MTKRETSTEIELAAAQWAVRVDAAPLDPDTDASLREWLNQDARRRGAYACARAMLLQARRAKALGADFDPDIYLADRRSDALSASGRWENIYGEEEERPNPKRLIGRRSFLIGGGAVAASAIATVIGWPSSAYSYTTARGEIRAVMLSDGSKMTLNTESSVRVMAGERLIELLDGEALLEVAEGGRSPFAVTAGDLRVWATDTSFLISRLAQRPVNIVVSEGVVGLEQPGSPQGLRRIKANNKVTRTNSGAVEIMPVSAADIAQELSWKEGMLSFQDTPLRDAAAQFARYNDKHIRLADSGVGEETVTGLFAVNNPMGFARTAAVSLGLRVRESPDGILIARGN